MAKNKFKVYLTDQKTGEQLELPVNPSEIKFKYETNDSQEMIVNFGQVNIVGEMKLATVSISSTFPKHDAHYVSTDKLLKPETYISKLSKIQKGKHQVRLVIATTKYSLLMTISNFEHGFENGFSDEYAYTLDLMQYRKFSYTKVNSPKSKGKKSGKSKKRASPPKKISVGSKVKVSGKLHADSYGRGAGAYLKNQDRQIIYIAKGREYPVCVGINGKPSGWVKLSEVKKA